MELDDKHDSLKRALRFEFDCCIEDKERSIEIYRTALAMKYNELASEMASDILHEFNITL